MEAPSKLSVRRGMEAPSKLTQINVRRGMEAPSKLTQIRKIVEKYKSAAFKLKIGQDAQNCNKMHQLFVAYPYPLYVTPLCDRCHVTSVICARHRHRGRHHHHHHQQKLT